METLNNSRFITYPSTVEKSNNHTVVLIDATANELDRLERFLKTSDKNFDVYLYKGEDYDLEWLNYITQSSDAYLINDASQVKVSHGSIRYGQDQDLKDPLDYFGQIEQQDLDIITQIML
jgi:hypothetical protein